MEDQIASKNQSDMQIKDTKELLQVDVPISNFIPDESETTIVSIPVENKLKDYITKGKDIEESHDLTEEVDIEPVPPNIPKPPTPLSENVHEGVKEIEVRRSGREREHRHD